MQRFILLSGLLWCAAFGGSSEAAVVMYDNFGEFQSDLNTFGMDRENILLDDKDGPLIEDGITVQGMTHQSDRIFDITGDEMLTVEASGHAFIDAEDGSFGFATISPNDETEFFSAFAFHIKTEDRAANFTITVDGMDSGGVPLSESFDASGSGFFGVIGTNGELFRSLTIETEDANQIADLRQLRVAVGELEQANLLPEPASLGIWSLVVVGGCAAGRIRKRASRRGK
ncbi:MAG: hypothetical protein WD847_06295 [Pirellulales bacterium]